MNDVKNDMERKMPMDRLYVAMFGKTEIAAVLSKPFRTANR